MRELLIRKLLVMYPPLTFVADFQNLVNQVQPGIWNDAVPITSTPRDAVNVIVDIALNRGWAQDLVIELAKIAPNDAELRTIQSNLAVAAPTVPDPFEEVLLEGDRPFVNRRDLRAQLRLLCADTGSTLLLISGDPKTGKSFSFYLAQHIARQRGIITSQFLVQDHPQVDQLASEILERIGVSDPLRARGTESAVRWGEKLATQVKDAIEARPNLRRFFVFDEFPSDPSPSLPPETKKFIVRLARYADEELRLSLRVLLIQFTDPLPIELDEVAVRDVAQPFTEADMLSVLQQVATARGWPVSPEALQNEIQQLGSNAALRTRFRFLKETIRRLRTSVAPGGPP